MQDPFSDLLRTCILGSQANTMEVHFHSDSSNNDWGVRMYIYGIMQVRPSTIAPQGRENGVSGTKRMACVSQFPLYNGALSKEELNVSSFTMTTG